VIRVILDNVTPAVHCLTHAACFPEGWEAEHAAGPLATGNGPCALVMYIAERYGW
jgi:hypothetical protein